MVVSIFFLLGLALLKIGEVYDLALVWSTIGSWHFVGNLLLHMFSHANLAHLMGNFIFVFPYALYVEYRVGAKAFVGWWIFAGFCAIAADLCVIIAGQEQSGIIGSSGAAFGIVAAALWLVRENKWARLACRFLVLWFLAEQGLNAWSAFAYPWLFRVAYIAHFGGILGGLYLAQRQIGLEARRSAAQDALKS